MSLKSLIRLAKERKANEQQLQQPSFQSSINQSQPIQTSQVKLSSAPSLNDQDWQTKYRIGSIPTCFYVKDWISADDEAELMREISRYQSNNQSSQQSNTQWVHVRGRKLLCFGPTPGQPIESCQAIPSFIESLINRANESSVVWPFDDQSELNHALINHYPRGGGIHAHKDGPAYHPRVVIISLGSPCIIRFDEKPPPAIDHSIKLSDRPKPPVALLLQPRSLLVFTDQLYTDYFHSIDPVTSDYVTPSTIDNYEQVTIESDGAIERTDRISITLRHAINK